MKPFERWGIHVGFLIAALTGLLYGWFRYFGQVQGEFGLEPHRFQGLWQHLHVLASPLLLFALGMVVRGHLYGKLKHGVKDGRSSGLLLAWLILPMVLSGYGVQVATNTFWRSALAWVHGSASIAFVVLYAAHLIRTWNLPRQQVNGEQQEVD